MRHLRPALLLALASAALAAHATVIDFENLVPPGAGNYFVIFPDKPVVSGGFRFDSPALDIFGPNSAGSGYNYTGSAALAPYSSNPRTTMAQVGGGAFTLDRIDLANLFATASGLPQGATIDFAGSLLGGGTVSQSFTIAPGDALQTFAFSGFSDVTSVTWNMTGTSYYQFDNVVVADPISPTVPGPMAAMPFALMALRRRKRA